MFRLSNELPPHAFRDYSELARVDPDVGHHAPHLSAPGDVGQPVVDFVDGKARDANVLALTPWEHQVRLDGTNHRVADQDVGNAWGNPEFC